MSLCGNGEPMVFKYAWRHVSNVMTKDVVTLGEEDSACKAAQLMLGHGIGCIVVVQGRGTTKKVVGIATEHDMLTVLAKHLNPDKVQLKDVMTPDPVTVHPMEDFMVASSIMEKHNIKKLPVVEAGYLVGIVTLKDITHAINELNSYYSFRLSTFEVPVTRPLGPGSRIIESPVKKVSKK